MSKKFQSVIDNNKGIIKKQEKDETPFREQLASCQTVKHNWHGDWLKYDIELQFRIVDWLDEKVKGKWVIPVPKYRFIYFQNEEDAVFYKLTWDGYDSKTE